MGVKGIKNTLNYGANRIRYLTPVPAGSKLRGGFSILSADVMPPNGLRGTPFPFRTFQAGLRTARANPGRVPSYFHRALVAPRFRSR
jgi:acyl dehydratase